MSQKIVRVTWESGSSYHVTKNEAQSLVARGLAIWGEERNRKILIRTSADQQFPTVKSFETGSGLVSRDVSGGIQSLLASELTRRAAYV